MKRIVIMCIACTLIAGSILVARGADYVVPFPVVIGDSTQENSAALVVTISADYYTFEPKDDITALELAKVLAVVMPALSPSCANGWQSGCDVRNEIAKLPPDIARHFSRHEGRK